MMAPPTPTTTPMMIFLSEEDTPLEPELLSPLREGELVPATGVEVVVITLAIVDPSLVAYEVMVFVTGAWVVVLWDEVVLSLPALVAEVGSVLEVVAATVDSEVEEGSAEVVGSVVESAVVGSVEVEEVVVVGSDVVVGSVEVSSEVVEEDDEVVDVVSGASEVEDEVVWLVTSDTMLETTALWAATAVNNRAWMKNDRLERRMVGITNVEYKSNERI